MAERKTAAKTAAKPESTDAGDAKSPAPADTETAKAVVLPKAKAPETRVVEVGGHKMTVDVPPPTPGPIEMCGVCGGSGCVHMDPKHGLGWELAEKVKPHETPSETHGADETQRSGLEADG